MKPPDDAAQLALDLPFDEQQGVDDFFVSASNEAAYAVVESWPHWVDPILVLTGPDGAGKSHLAAIWAERASAWRCPLDQILTASVPGLVTTGALLIEDVDRGPFDEAALFHVLNAVRERGGSILFTSRREPGEWGLRTPDLISRLRRAPIAAISPPDDGLLRAVLVKLFLDRQLTVDTRVIDTIILRAERSFAAARAVVEALDQAALASGRRITRSMAQDVIARLTPQDGQET